MHLQERQGDGATLRQHLQRLATNTGKVDDRLLDAVPPAGAQLWDTYQLLSASRRSGMGLHSLTLVDIEAWCRLYRVQLTPWELDTLIHIDAAALAIAAEQQSRTRSTH